VIILTAIVQVLSTLSSYFWYFWLLVRLRDCSDCNIMEVSLFQFYCKCIICSLFTPGTCKGFAFTVGKLPGPLVFCRFTGSPWREREEWQETEATGKTTDEEILDSVYFFVVVILHLLYNYKEHAMNWSFLFSHLDPFSYLISVLKSLAQVHHSHKSCWFFCSELNAHKMPLLTIVSFH